MVTHEKGADYPIVVEELAKAFRRCIRDSIPLHHREVVDRLNKTAEYEKSCATHNFCDPNMSMHWAFMETLDREPDLEDQSDLDLMNDAWTSAREHGFSKN